MKEVEEEQFWTTVNLDITVATGIGYTGNNEDAKIPGLFNQKLLKQWLDRSE